MKKSLPFILNRVLTVLPGLALVLACTYLPVQSSWAQTYIGNQSVIDASYENYIQSTAIPAMSSRFTLPGTGTHPVTAIYINAATNNASGNTGTYTISLQTDSAGAPSGVTLTSTTVTFPTSGGSSTYLWYVISVPSAPLTSGSIYQIVVDGSAISSNKYLLLTSGSTPFNQIFPLGQYLDTNCNSVTYTGTSWGDKNEVPCFILQFNDASFTDWGDPYDDLAPYPVNATNWASQVFTVPSGPLFVNTIGTYLYSYNNPAANLNATLLDLSAASTLGSVTILNSSVSTTDNWVDVNLSSPVSLNSTDTYELFFSSSCSNSTTYYIPASRTDSTFYDLTYEGTTSYAQYAEVTPPPAWTANTSDDLGFRMSVFITPTPTQTPTYSPTATTTNTATTTPTWTTTNSPTNTVTVTPTTPPTNYSITDNVANVTALPNGLLMFRCVYDYGNTGAVSVTITSSIPSNTSLVEAGPPGSESGAVSGSGGAVPITWTLPPSLYETTGSVYMLVRVGSVSGGTQIQSACTLTAGTSIIDGNTSTSTVGPVFTLSKTESETTANPGDAVTYTLNWSLTGEALTTFDTYNNDTVGATAVTGYDGTPYTASTWTGSAFLGIWTIGNTSLGADHYITVNGEGSTPLLLRNSPTMTLQNNNYTVVGDLYLDPSNLPNPNAVLVGAWDTTNNNGYVVGLSASANPGNLYLTKYVNDSPTPLATVTNASLPTNITTGNWYTAELSINGFGSSVTLYAKTWPFGGAIPPNWAVTVADSSPLPLPNSYHVGWQAQGGLGACNDLQIYSANGAVSMMISDTLPTGLTYVSSAPTPSYQSGSLVSWSFPGTLVGGGNSYSIAASVSGSCVTAINQAAIGATNASILLSNPVTLPISCFTSTATSTPTSTATSSPTLTPTSSATNTPTNTTTLTTTNTATLTTTNTATSTATNTTTNTSTLTPSSTPTFTPTFTATLTPTNTATLTPTNTTTNTATNTATLTATNTTTNTPTLTPTSTATLTATSTPTYTTTQTATSTTTNTATNTPTNTLTNTPTNSATNTTTNTSTNTPTLTPTNTPTGTSTNTPIFTNTPTSTATKTPTSTASATPTNSPTNTASFTATNTFANTPTLTPTSTATLTATNTPTFTPTSTPTNTPTLTPTGTPSSTATNTSTKTATSTTTNTSTATASNTPTNSATQTPTATPTSTPTNTSTSTVTSSFTATPSSTPTFTMTNTATSTASFTTTNTPLPTSTPTATPTFTTTSSPTSSFTATSTFTPTQSPTFTYTPTITFTPTITNTYTPTGSVTPTPTPNAALYLDNNFFNPDNGPLGMEVRVDVAGEVKIVVFNIAGEEVEKLVDQQLSTGNYRFSWDGHNSSGAIVGNAVYFIVSEQPSGNLVRKVIVLK